MGVVKRTLVIPAPLETVYVKGQKMGEHLEYIPNVKSFALLEGAPEQGYVVAKWSAIGKVAGLSHTIEWIQEDRWDHEKKRCDFKMRQGDYKHYRGHWEFLRDSQGTKVILEVDFKIEHPMVNPLTEILLDKMMKANCDSLLKALAKIVERN